MKRIIAACIIALLPSLASAQSVPQMSRQVTLAGPTGLNWAMSLKADASKGVLANPTETNGTYSAPSITGGTSTNQTLNNPTVSAPSITNGTATGTDVSATTSTATGATSGVTLAADWRRRSIFPDDFKTTADGTDDAPSIQRAANLLCHSPGAASSGGTILLAARIYEIDSAITLPCALSMRGQGWEEQMTLGGGTWLHITSTLGNSSAFTLSSTYTRASQFYDFAVTEDHPTPSTTASTAWTPTVYAPVFNLNGVGASVFFNHLLFDGVYQGIYTNGAGRVELDGIYADIFSYLIDVDGAEDVDRFRNVHIWPYWTNSAVAGSSTSEAMTTAQQNNVTTYKLTNANGIILNRADSPMLEDIFGIALHSTLEIGYTTTSTGNAGTTTKGHIGTLLCDQSVYCLWVQSAVTTQASLQIDQLDWQGENSTDTGTPNTGGSAIELDGNANLQISIVHAEFVGSAVINMPNTTECSQIYVGSMYANFAYSGTNVPAIYSVACGTSAYDIVDMMDFRYLANSGGGITVVDGPAHVMMPTLVEQNSSAQ
ncbi:hypothetical protein JK185_10310 [Gluconobacter wancherniae]|uniref:hypothetical protein n=1 Tax=Gluconobacter wancherniae TaxID=1307955 RepID=UPI001B8CF804|nr:hypothetical protein [Gluconobacter wancherniae]MBS1063435.1 hypothetical protein [Gluconobacter wancherniae]